MTATALWKQVTIDRLMLGNAFVLIERDIYGEPDSLWIARGGYDTVSGTYNLAWFSDGGIRERSRISHSDVLHFPNTYKRGNSIMGISTLQYAFDSLSLIKTESHQALESAAKGGRVKLLIGEDRPTSAPGTLAYGMFSKDQGKAYAKEINDDIYKQDVVSLHGLDKVQQISMTAAEMQMVELLGMGLDDVARFWATPRSLLMLDSNSHYTSYKDANQEYYTRTIAPDAREMEDEFTRKFLSMRDYGMRRFHLCEMPLMRMDRESQAKIDEINLRTGVKTVNELRQQYDLPRIDGGDITYISTNLAEIGSEKLRSTGGNGNTPYSKVGNGENNKYTQ